jgi:hypothetical protein
MGNLLSNTIYNYNQVYDTLRTVKLNDYLLDKRDNVHNSLFNAALNKLMLSVNFVLRYLYNKVIADEYNPNDLKSNLPFLVCDSVIKICEAIMSHYVLVADKTLVIWDNDGADRNDLRHRLNWVDTMSNENVENSSTEFWEDIETVDKNANLLKFNKLNYQFIEYKDKNWLKPSSILIIYTSSLIQKGNEGPYKRLTIGPISLTEFWNADYVHNNSLNEIIAENTPKYVIENVDYVNGTCKLFDKINMRFLTVNLDKIKNLNNFEFDGIIDNYDEMFHVKRKTNII